MGGPMAGFASDDRGLVCDDVPVAEIAARVGTPVHVYSAALIRERYRALDAAFASRPHRLHYAIKANSTTAVVRELRSLGARADANSGGEIEVALRAGFSADQIVFTGVGKTRAELERAIGLGVAAINAESPGEVDRIAAIAQALGTVTNVAVRVNPDVAAGAHPHISTGKATTKFGVSARDAAGMLRDMAHRPVLRIAGLHVHIGSQITTTAPIVAAVQAIVDLAQMAATEGIRMRHLEWRRPGLPRAGAAGPQRRGAPTAAGCRPDTDLEVAPEPAAGSSRLPASPSGSLTSKGARSRVFVVVDAGMTDLIRPAFMARITASSR
jgi:diaminopimelate decarboxylase